MAVDERTLLVNHSASTLVGSHDRALLWAWAKRRIGGPDMERNAANARSVILPSGARPSECEAVRTGTVLRGALIWFDSPLAPQSASEELRRTREEHWSSLTASEYNVACHVARGLTNREVAVLLHISHHTVDYHLRQVFRKLRIRSRVELARLVATDQEMARVR